VYGSIDDGGTAVVAEQLDSGVATAGPSAPVAATMSETTRRRRRRAAWVAAMFIAPAAVLLGALMIYPIFATVYRSMYDASGSEFVGVGNYREMFSGGGVNSDTIRMLFWLIPLVTLAVLAVLGVLAATRRMASSSAYRAAIWAAAIGFALLAIVFLFFQANPPRTLVAIKNNVIWVIFAPTLATVLGLVFAVLTERIRWSTAFKVAVFMPMAISLLAAGVIWRFVYDQNPELGLANAGVRAVADVFRPPGAYPGARPTQPEALVPDPNDKGALATTQTVNPGQTANIGLVGVQPRLIPADAQPAAPAASAQPAPGAISGVVWNDFTRGGGGEKGVVDATEQGLPGSKVEAVRNGEVVASATTGNNGAFTLTDLGDGPVTLRLASSNFREQFAGVNWLGPTLVTPAIIVSFLWIWAGFAMVVISAGLAALPREVLEAARTDGATEWQVFRRVTVPLLAPVLLVVIVTLSINVLKIFDLVLVIPPGSSQDDANVIALEMWRTAFGGGNDEGLGSALAVLLFLLVLPVMLVIFRRFRAEQN
jgi:alpha-glucoside transport system permease protein